MDHNSIKPTETTVQKIKREMLGTQISEDEYNKAVATGLESLPDDYIDYTMLWPNGDKTHYYYKIPKVPDEDLPLIIAERTRRAAEETERHTRQIKIVFFALIILGFIASLIINNLS